MKLSKDLLWVIPTTFRKEKCGEKEISELIKTLKKKKAVRKKGAHKKKKAMENLKYQTSNKKIGQPPLVITCLLQACMKVNKRIRISRNLKNKILIICNNFNISYSNQ